LYALTKIKKIKSTMYFISIKFRSFLNFLDNLKQNSEKIQNVKNHFNLFRKSLFILPLRKKMEIYDTFLLLTKRKKRRREKWKFKQILKKVHFPSTSWSPFFSFSPDLGSRHTNNYDIQYNDKKIVWYFLATGFNGKPK
jgi:hypothetical protein